MRFSKLFTQDRKVNVDDISDIETLKEIAMTHSDYREG